MPPKKVMIHYAGADGDFFAMSTPSKCGKRLIIHETDEKKKNLIKTFTKNSDAILYENEPVDKKTLSKPPQDRHVEEMLGGFRHAQKSREKKNEPTDALQVVSLGLGSLEAPQPPMSWKTILFYLLVASPIYIPIICYIAAPLFDYIIDFLKPTRKRY